MEKIECDNADHFASQCSEFEDLVKATARCFRISPRVQVAVFIVILAQLIEKEKNPKRAYESLLEHLTIATIELWNRE